MNELTTSLQLSREHGDDRSEAAGLGRTAEILTDMHRWSDAAQRYEEALAAARRADDAGLEASLLQHMGGLLRYQGDNKGAVERYQQALALFQKLDDVGNEMRTCDLLGSAEKNLEHYDSARAWYERSRELAQRLGDRRHLAIRYPTILVLANHDSNSHSKACMSVPELNYLNCWLR